MFDCAVAFNGACFLVKDDPEFSSVQNRQEKKISAFCYESWIELDTDNILIMNHLES